ncbi:long-chain fatty alcohol oxidase, FAO1 [Pseudohyphozyma bogoriensis]|nr:long-chain fatty alcohol oxidase, FAO1 [Pseudohyphozyma bogoriensis]
MAAPNVPRISLHDFDNRREEIKKELIAASSEVGFFTLINHSIPVAHIDEVFEWSKKFFDLPTEVKAKTPWNGKNMGWEYRSQIRPSTGYADPKESIQLGLGLGPDMAACWPSDEDCEGFRKGAEKFTKEVQALSIKVMEMLAEGVGLPKETLVEGSVCPEDSDKEDSMSTLRMLKYHSCEGQDLGPNYFRAGAHADFDILTLLFQKVGQDGLELCPGRSISTDFGFGDKWTTLKIQEGEIVCNIGDQLMRWSDDKLKSTFHRVTCPRPGEYQGDRYSIGFFNQARKSANMQGPLKSYPPITGAEFIAQAMKRNYEAALNAAKLQTYEVSAETELANKDFVVSGTGLSRPPAVKAA